MLVILGDRFKRGALAAVAPLIYTALFLLLSLVWITFSLPDPEKIFNYILGLFHTYGLIIVASAAFIEGLVLVNIYFPGSAVILIGMVAEKGNAVGATLVVLVTMAAFLVSGMVNYGIGYFGMHKVIRRFGGDAWLKQAEAWYERSGHRAILTSFMHPNLGAFISVACGNARYPFGTFMKYALLGAIAWNTLWGLIAYNFADIVKNVATQSWSVVALLLGWALVAFFKGYFKGEGGKYEEGEKIV